jgi:hypothetical protein
MTLQQLPLKFRLALQDYNLVINSGIRPVSELAVNSEILIHCKPHPLG